MIDKYNIRAIKPVGKVNQVNDDWLESLTMKNSIQSKRNKMPEKLGEYKKWVLRSDLKKSYCFCEPWLLKPVKKS